MYLNGKLIYFEDKQVSNNLDYIYHVYFFDGEMIVNKSRGKLPLEYEENKAAKQTILNSSARILQQWKKMRGSNEEGEVPSYNHFYLFYGHKAEGSVLLPICLLID